ncbi:MAG: endonuclease/exonuclease/phosphatase family protein [Flavobacteriales bacterium]
MKIAFWNINKKELSDLLVEFVNENQIDVLLLAEVEEKEVLNFIIKQNLINPSRKYFHISNNKVNILSSFSPKIFKKQNIDSNSPRWSSYMLDFPSFIKFNLICVHFHSKVNWSEDSLALECVNLSRDIDYIETSTGVNETIVIGDFNMNPYESGLVAANGLHAMPDLNHISSGKGNRQIDGITYKYFYNPMWTFFGDKELPYGTHYYREPGHVSREWNIYDQVIYRPSLSKHIDKNKIEIIHKIGGQNLITALNRPDKKNYSDHLPIIFEINI